MLDLTQAKTQRRKDLFCSRKATTTTKQETSLFVTTWMNLEGIT